MNPLFVTWGVMAFGGFLTYLRDKENSWAIGFLFASSIFFGLAVAL